MNNKILAIIIFGGVFLGIWAGIRTHSLLVIILSIAIGIGVLYNKLDFGESSKQDSEEDDVHDYYFKHTMLVLMAAIMKADGKLKSSELDSVKATIRRYYKGEDTQKAALKEFQTILQTQYDIKEICDSINDRLDDVGVVELFMELLAVAYADDDFSDKEKPVIKKIRDFLGLTTQEYQRIYALFMKKRQDGFYRTKKAKSNKTNNSYRQSYNYNQNSNQSSNQKEDKQSSRIITIEEQEAYDILGVPYDISDEEVKKAYRALALMYHPDKVAHLSDEAIRQATESMKKINEAWDTVKEARGIK